VRIRKKGGGFQTRPYKRVVKAVLLPANHTTEVSLRACGS
jgi:hypothetical protein